jgi:hypothetical protein
VRDRLQAPDGQSDVHYQALNYRAFMCSVLDLDQIGCLQPGLKFDRYRHHFEELCSLREKISTRLLSFVLILMTLPDCRNACATAFHFRIASHGQLRAAVLKLIAERPQSNHVDSGTDETGESEGAGPYAPR